MSIVIAFIIIVAGFVGYHASQETPEAKGHDISSKLYILDAHTTQHHQVQTIAKSII